MLELLLSKILVLRLYKQLNEHLILWTTLVISSEEVRINLFNDSIDFGRILTLKLDIRIDENFQALLLLNFASMTKEV